MTSVWDRPAYCSKCGGVLINDANAPSTINIYSGERLEYLVCEKAQPYTSHDYWERDPYESEEQWMLVSARL